MLLHRTVPVFLLLALAVPGCAKKSVGDSSIYEAGFSDPASTYAGLAFATVDAGYTSSTLLFNDFTVGVQRPLSTGESGDPFLAWVGESLFLFNRTAASLNVRTLDPRQAPAQLSKQIATPGAAVGDPHATLLLDSGRLLLAMYNAGKLVVINPATGALVQEITAAWDLGGGAASQFRPEALHLRDVGDGTHEVFVLHQGTDQNFKADGSQAVFVLKDDGKTLTPVDLDASKDGIQGMPLVLKAPAAFFPGDSADQVLIYGECTTFDEAACKQGFVELAMSTRTITPVWDTGTTGLKGNGGIVKGSGKLYYELMAKANGAKVIEALDLGAQTTTDLYTFKSQSGCCALYFDDSSGTLYAGDEENLEIFKGGVAPPAEVALGGIAYSGVFVSK